MRVKTSLDKKNYQSIILQKSIFNHNLHKKKCHLKQCTQAQQVKIIKIWINIIFVEKNKKKTNIKDKFMMKKLQINSDNIKM